MRERLENFENGQLAKRRRSILSGALNRGSAATRTTFGASVLRWLAMKLRQEGRGRQ